MKILLVLLTCLTTFINPRALVFDGLYSDVSSNSTNAENLINYASNIDDSFGYSDYIVFCPERYNYYIVWADELSFVNGGITGSDIQFISYIRDSDTLIYSYDFGTDSTFSLTNVDYLITSNIGVGIASPIFNELLYQKNMINLAIFSVACISGLFIVFLRKE